MGGPALFANIPYDAAYNVDLALLAVFSLALVGFAFIGRRHKMSRANGIVFVVLYAGAGPHATTARYPSPRIVSILKSSQPSKRERSRFTCTSTVRSALVVSQPHTSSSSCRRV